MAALTSYEKYKGTHIKYRKKNAVKIKKAQKKYMENYFDKERFGGNRYKALERDCWVCQGCGMSQEEHMYKFKMSLTVDHIDGKGRYSKIKNHKLDNLQTLCLVCHGKKEHRPTKK